MKKPHGNTPIEITIGSPWPSTCDIPVDQLTEIGSTPKDRINSQRSDQLPKIGSTPKDRINSQRSDQLPKILGIPDRYFNFHQWFRILFFDGMPDPVGREKSTEEFCQYYFLEWSIWSHSHGLNGELHHP